MTLKIRSRSRGSILVSAFVLLPSWFPLSISKNIWRILTKFGTQKQLLCDEYQGWTLWLWPSFQGHEGHLSSLKWFPLNIWRNISWSPTSFGTRWYAVALNDLYDFENEIKVTWFEHGLRPALVLLCTKFGEDMSYISSDIEQKPFRMAFVTLKITGLRLECALYAVHYYLKWLWVVKCGNNTSLFITRH